MNDASGTIKAVTLELGGKSPILVFDDAKLDQAVSGALLGNFYSAGEVCSNGTRVFVHRKVKDEFLRKLAARVGAMKIGDPMDPATQVGSLISGEHMEMVLGYIDRGRQEGARILVGGNRRTEGALAKGFFVEPTVFDGCQDAMSIVREEIFGPVMSVLEFDDEDEVVARANATEFGLSAGVFTNDLNRAHRVIAKLRGRHLLDQPLQRHADRAAVRRRQALRTRARERPRRDGALHPAQERLRREGRHRRAVLSAAVTERGIRLRHRRRRFGRLRACQPADRGRQSTRAAPRVRRLRPLDLHADALGALHPDGHGEVRLALLHRTGARPRRPPPAHAARQGARRLVVDQRPRLRARQCAGFRTLGGGGRDAAGTMRPCCRTSAVPRRAPKAATITAATPARCTPVTARCANPLYARLARGGPAGRLSRDGRHQRLPAGRLRAVRHDGRSRRAALQRGQRLSAPGHAAAEPRRSAPMPLPRASCSRARARSASSTGTAAPCARRPRAAR